MNVVEVDSRDFVFYSALGVDDKALRAMLYYRRDGIQEMHLIVVIFHSIVSVMDVIIEIWFFWDSIWMAVLCTFTRKLTMMPVLKVVENLKAIVVSKRVHWAILSLNLPFVEEENFFIAPNIQDVFQNTCIAFNLQRDWVRGKERMGTPVAFLHRSLPKRNYA